jgi:hypothetical protein
MRILRLSEVNLSSVIWKLKVGPLIKSMTLKFMWRLESSPGVLPHVDK